MTNHPTKYESYRTKDLRGDVFTKINYIDNVKSPITPTKIVKLKWWDNTITTHDQSSYQIYSTNQKTIYPHIYYYNMQDI
jgi:hypothetical protein